MESLRTLGCGSKKDRSGLHLNTKNALQAPGNHTAKSKHVCVCYKLVNKQGHRGVKGNPKANDLAKLTDKTAMTGTEQIVEEPLLTMSSRSGQQTNTSVNVKLIFIRWQNDI